MLHPSSSAIVRKLFVFLFLAAIFYSPFDCFADDDDEGEATLLEVRADPPGMHEGPIPFGVGEEITLHVSFSFIPAGKAKLQVVDTTRINGQLAYYIVSTARSAKGFDWVFKVRDSIQTWMDVDSLYSHRFRKQLREGGYRDEKVVEFDFADSLARWWDDRNEKEPLPVEPFVQDVFSATMKTRTLPMEVGDTLVVRMHDVKKTYDLFIIIHGREMVESLAGTFECFKAEPILKSGGLFKKERKARLFVWVTTDERRIPVLITSKVSFGTFKVQLESYTPPRFTLPGPVKEVPIPSEKSTMESDSIGIDR